MTKESVEITVYVQDALKQYEDVRREIQIRLPKRYEQSTIVVESDKDLKGQLRIDNIDTESEAAKTQLTAIVEEAAEALNLEVVD